MANKQESSKPLLLEGPSAAWRAGARGSEEGAVIDALPYFDKEYEDASLRAEVNRLVQEEMRRSKKRPADFLKELPPVPPLRPEKCPMVARECDRVRAGKPPASGVDLTRYEPKQLTGSRAHDPGAWKTAAQQACCHLQHLDGRRLNLELMQQFGANSWKVHNQHLEAFLAKTQQEVAEVKRRIETVNRDRKLNQQAAAAELSRLNAKWREGVRKNMEIEAACGNLQSDIHRLRARAGTLGLDINPQMETH